MARRDPTSSEIVRQARERSGLTKSSLAARVGTSRAALDQIEKGQRVPRIDTILRVLDAAGGEFTIRWPSPVTGCTTLAGFCGELDTSDDQWVWRSLISDFVANEFVPAAAGVRAEMLWPAPIAMARPRWNTFVAALAEHLAFHGELVQPPWTSAGPAAQPLASFWWPVHGGLGSTRAAAMANSPASFKRRRILVDRSDLPLIVP